MNEFTRKPTCEKCGNDVVALVYNEQSAEVKLLGRTYPERPERIDITCSTCGHEWGMKCLINIA